MSYSFINPCYNCRKANSDMYTAANAPGTGSCTDYQEIQKAISAIHSHSAEEGHQGSGVIVLSCQIIDAIYK